MSDKITDPALLKKLNALAARQRGEVPKVEEGFSAKTMVGNVWPSAKRYAKDIVTPFIHPLETAEAVGGLAGSAFAKGEEALVDLAPEGAVRNINKFNNWVADKTGLLTPLPEEKKDMRAVNTEKAEAVGQFFSDRYGSGNKLSQTLMTDPVGVVGDAAGLLMGGSTLLPKTSKLAQGTSKVGAAIDPLNVAINTGKTATGLLTPKGLPASLYQSGAKFPNAVNSPDPAVLTETALKHNLMPTAEGVGRLEMAVSDLVKDIDNMIKAADSKGVNIPKSAVFKHLKELRSDIGGAKLHGAKNKAVINNIAKKFDQHMDSIGKDTLTPSELNDFKKDIYKAINFNTKNRKGQRAAEQAEKAIARAAKEIIEQQDPRIAGQNKELGRLLELQQPLLSSARRIDKRNPISIDSALNVTAGGMAGGAPGVLGGGAVSLLAYPKVTTGMANKLNQLKGRGLSSMGRGSLPLGLLDQALVQFERERERY